MIHKFVSKAEECLERDGDIPCLGIIFSEIQEELGQTKQLQTYTWNNKTDLIKFNKNIPSKTTNTTTASMEMQILMKSDPNTNDKE